MTNEYTYTSPTHLVGKTPGQITSSGKVSGLGAKGTVWLDKGQQPDGSWLYWRKGYAPPVVTPEPPMAPPPPPASSARIVAAGGEVFMQSSKLAVGIGACGSLGTMGRAPEGFITDAAAGYVRLGMVAIADGKIVGGEALLKGTPIEGYAIGYRVGGKAKVLRCFEQEGTVQMTGRTEIIGGEAVTTATAAGLKVVQHAALASDGDALQFTIYLTNTGTDTLTDLRYMRLIDPDHAADPNAFKTENRIVEAGKVTAKAGALTLSLSSPDPHASASIVAFAKALSLDPAAASKAVGTVSVADEVLTLSAALGELAPGATATFVFSIGSARG